MIILLDVVLHLDKELVYYITFGKIIVFKTV